MRVRWGSVAGDRRAGAREGGLKPTEISLVHIGKDL